MRKPKPGYKLVKSLFGKYEEIPEEWEVKKTDDVFEFLISGTNARSDLNDSDEIRYIHYGDIHTKWNLQLDCDLEKIPRIDEEKVSKLTLLKDGDLIIADVSEDVEGSGTSISLKNVKNKKFVAGLHTLVLRSKDENISFEFMKYLTSISHVKIQIISYVTGAKVFGLSKKSCKEIKVPFPTLPEQEKIASILSSVDDLINKYDEIIHSTKLLKTGLMQQLLTKGIGHKKFKKEFLKYRFLEILIPESWDIKNVKQISALKNKSVKTGPFGLMLHSSDYVSEGTPLILIKNIQNGKIFDEDIPKISEKDVQRLSEYRVKEGDMIFTRVGRVGSSALVEKKHTGWLFSGQTLRIRFDNPELNSKFVNYYFHSELFNRVLIPELLGATRDSINTTILEQIPVVIPPKKEQDRIVSILMQMDEKISELETKKKSLESLKKGLMQKLLTGQIRVKV